MARKQTFEDMGITITFPDEFENTTGSFLPLPLGGNNGIYTMMFNYIAMTDEEGEAFQAGAANGTPSEEAVAAMVKRMSGLYMLMGIDGGRGPEDIIKISNTDTLTKEMFTEVGRCEDITYYVVAAEENDDDKLKEWDPVFQAEFRTLKAALPEALKNAEYFAPKIPGADLAGQTIRFKTVDIDGKPVKSEDLFASHAVTMINVWATWCGPCKSELRELGNIHRRLQEKNAAIVGICLDADEKPEECRRIVADNQIDYLTLLPYEMILEKLPLQSIPTSFFVDCTGKVMTDPVIGVPGDISFYETTIDLLLLSSEAGSKRD